MESQFWIPTVQRGGRALDVYSSMLEDGIIFVNAPIDQRVAGLINSCLLELSRKKEGAKRPKIYLNTNKGDIIAAMEVVDIVEWCQKRQVNVETMAFGEVGIAAAVVLTAGSGGMRKVARHCQISLYLSQDQLELGGIVSTDAKARQATRVQQMVSEHLAQRTRLAASDYLSTYLNRQGYLPAAEAIEIGLADGNID